MVKGKFQKWLTPDGRTLLEAWARDGLTDEQTARNMGVNRATPYAWKAKYPDISGALKRGKEIVDVEVENALLKRANGFQWTETRVEQMPAAMTGNPDFRCVKTVGTQYVMLKATDGATEARASEDPYQSRPRAVACGGDHTISAGCRR